MEENVFAGIEKEQIKLPLDILDEYEKQFFKAFGDSLAFQIVSDLENNNTDWMKLDPFRDLREPSEQKYVSRVYVVVPRLDNYRLLILKVSYFRSKVYPCDLFNALTNNTEQCANSETLTKELTKLFLSDEFQKPIRILLSQI